MNKNALNATEFCMRFITSAIEAAEWDRPATGAARARVEQGKAKGGDPAALLG